MMVLQFIARDGSRLISFPPNNLWTDRGNNISDTNLVINKNITEELLLENNPRSGKHKLIDFKLQQKKIIKEHLVTKFLEC